MATADRCKSGAGLSQDSGDVGRRLPVFIARKVCGECGLVPPWCDHDRKHLRTVRYYPCEGDVRYGHPDEERAS